MTRQQRWALRAHEEARAFARSGQKTKFRTFGLKMPGLIQQSGLVQAVVFLESREGEVGQQFVAALARVYQSEGQPNLVELSRTANMPAYLALTRDLLEVSTWVRRFVQIEIPEGNG